MFGGFGADLNSAPTVASLNSGGLNMGTDVNTDVNSNSAQSVAAGNMSLAKNPGSIVFWVGLLVLYLFYDWLQNEKLESTLQPANIRANAHNQTHGNADSGIVQVCRQYSASVSTLMKMVGLMLLAMGALFMFSAYKGEAVSQVLKLPAKG